MTKRRKIVIACIIGAILAVGAAYYVYAGNGNDDKRVETTSKSPTAQSDYSGGEERQSNSSSGNSQGGATDTKGQDVPTNPGGGVSSESGVITVHQPAKDAVLSPGAVLSGVAARNLSKVEYRLIDENVGVIAQGSLSVVEGKYSGKLQFSSNAKTGRLDVFSFDDQGVEVNNIEITVRF